MENNMNYRILVQADIECDTPLKVGSGSKDIITDERVLLDANELPYIPGTSLAGILRHQMTKEDGDSLFGSKTEGSRIRVTDTCLMYEGGKVVEGILENRQGGLEIYDDLPVRQHVRIGYNGTHEKSGKFDEQVVYAGSRFRFELELKSGAAEDSAMNILLKILKSGVLRLGGGTRRGFGKMTVLALKKKVLNLSVPGDLALYLEKSSSLNYDWKLWTPVEISRDIEKLKWRHIALTLQPRDFFLFSSGFGEGESDIAPLKEAGIKWEGSKPELAEDYKVVPAASVKGALSHRVAFHYNKLIGNTVEKVKGDFSLITGNNNKAVLTLFGGVDETNNKSHRGNLIVSDLYIDAKNHLMKHITIDNYTGGIYDGHLFTESVSWRGNIILSLDILVNDDALVGDNIKKALELTLNDLCEGYLPLGGGVNRGHGVFQGAWSLSEEITKSN